MDPFLPHLKSFFTSLLLASHCIMFLASDLCFVGVEKEVCEGEIG